MRLQLVGPDGSKVAVTNLDEGSLVGALQEAAAKAFGLDAGEQQWMCGFPPKTVTATANATLQEAGIANGSRITVARASNVQHGVVKGDAQDAKDVIYTIRKQGRGHMAKRAMPGDNSCLFHSVAYLCMDRATGKAAALRQIVASAVAADPRTWSAQVLGQPPAAYRRWILDENTWGGGIELALLSSHFETEIVSFDYAYLRQDVFGQGSGYKKRIFVIYTGNHYDAMVWDDGTGRDQMQFSSRDEYAWKRARDYAQFLHEEAVKADPSLRLQKEWRRDKPTQGHSMQ